MELEYLLHFLARLAAHNTTAWMAEHRPDYQRARAACTELVRQVLARVAATDPELATLAPTEVMFRLHKNDRAHRDPEPYKRRMGAGLKRGGRHAPRAGYFLAIQPEGRSWLGAGTFHPTPELLAAIRQEIHYSSDEFHQLRQAPELPVRLSQVLPLVHVQRQVRRVHRRLGLDLRVCVRRALRRPWARPHHPPSSLLPVLVRQMLRHLCLLVVQ